jgi:hypothetical protein
VILDLQAIESLNIVYFLCHLFLVLFTGGTLTIGSNPSSTAQSAPSYYSCTPPSPA